MKNIILEGRGFRGGSDEKMKRMWLRLEIAVAGLLPSLPSIYVTFVPCLGVHTIFSTYDKSDNGSGTEFNEFEIDRDGHRFYNRTKLFLKDGIF